MFKETSTFKKRAMTESGMSELMVTSIQPSNALDKKCTPTTPGTVLLGMYS